MAEQDNVQPDHPHRRSSDMVCSEHSNMMEQLRKLNSHFEKLLDPDEGILVRQKIKIDRLESFKKVVVIVFSAMGLPVLGALGLFIWEKLKGR
jgi:hypothetical protein